MINLGIRVIPGTARRSSNAKMKMESLRVGFDTFANILALRISFCIKLISLIPRTLLEGLLYTGDSSQFKVTVCGYIHIHLAAYG